MNEHKKQEEITLPVFEGNSQRVLLPHYIILLKTCA